MRSQDFLHPSPIFEIADTETLGLLGHSFGGAVGLGATQDEICIPGICSEDYTLPPELQAGIFYGTSFRDQQTGEFLPIDNEGIAVGLIQGSLDGVVPPSYSQTMLLLHGGPGITHEYLEAFDSYFPAAGIEYYYFDQLGSAYSDQPDELELWELPRFVDEVEQVRQALGLDRENFYLFGQSWGGLLAIEYALKYQQHLKGLVISNMMASIPDYNEYAQKTLMPMMDQSALNEIKRLEAAGEYENPHYMELLIQHFYVHHLLRMPPEEWPDPVNRAFKHLNPNVYIPMQGPSELGLSGKLVNWNRTADLDKIAVPTLCIGARYDTMNPTQMEMMSWRVQKGEYLYCPAGSHLSIYDDQKVYFDGLIRFIRNVEANCF